MEEEENTSSGADQSQGTATAHVPGTIFHPEGASAPPAQEIPATVPPLSVDPGQDSTPAPLPPPVEPASSPASPAPAVTPTPLPPPQPPTVVAHEPKNHPYKKRFLGKALLLIILLIILAVAVLAYIFFFKV